MAIPKYEEIPDLTSLISIVSFDEQYDNLDLTTLTIYPRTVTLLPEVAVGSYKITYTNVDYFMDPNYVRPTQISATSPITLTGLTPGESYVIKVEAFEGANATGASGTSVQKTIKMPAQIDISKILTSQQQRNLPPEDVSALKEWIAQQNQVYQNQANGILQNAGTAESVQRSLLSLTNMTQNKNDINIVYKSLSGMTVTAPADMYNENLTWGPNYYSFGTTLFLDDDVITGKQCGGIGFFCKEGGKDGYFLEIDTTASSAAIDTQKEIRLLKIKNGDRFLINDSQSQEVSKLYGIYGGKAYRIDIKVKSTDTQNTFTIYVNGFKITAVDKKDLVGTQTNPEKNFPLKPTSIVAAYAKTGTVNFDYIYGISIDENQYNNSDAAFNIFNGQYSNNSLKFQFGNEILDVKSKAAVKGQIEEFGPVAREIRNINIKFENRPAEPVYASTGINKFVEVVGSTFTHFGSNMYVLNNSGTYSPLSDGQDYDFSIIGSSIVRQSGQEYSSTVPNEYSTDEPLTFDSQWIQSISEAAQLESWFKTVWSGKQMEISLDVFGNPLLSVGDVIQINYPYHNLTTSKKFVITSVRQSYNDGLETSITCRTL